MAHTEASSGAELPRFVKNEFDAFLECSILDQGFQWLRCGRCWHDKLLALSCKRRELGPSCGARRMVTRHLLGRVGLEADEGHGGSVTPIQRFGLAAKLNTPLHGLVLARADALGSEAFKGKRRSKAHASAAKSGCAMVRSPISPIDIVRSLFK